MGRVIFLMFLKCSHPAFPSQSQSTNQVNVHVGASAGSDSPSSSAPWLPVRAGREKEERKRLFLCCPLNICLLREEQPK